MMPEIKAKIKHDGLLQLAVGKSRKEMNWKNQELLWSELVDKLSVTTRTRETSAEYSRMSKDDQSSIKDVGGFVGGMLKGGRRRSGSVAWRSMITLDADYADETFIDTVRMLFNSAVVLYSTHSHRPKRKRLRMIVPLASSVAPDKYKALCRFVAAEIGIDYFDDSTYEPERLMYWPSTSEDGEYLFDFIDNPWLDPDEVLSHHPNWEDASTWPESSRATKIREKHAEKQGDPRTKPGIVGAFCRTYSISAAISEFLSDVYAQCELPNRYTFTGGSTAAGLVVYDDLFAFSHHGTDPASGMLCNAFDLVRLHKFGIQDDDAKPDTPINKLPSFKAMSEWAVSQDAVKVEIASGKLSEAKGEFGEVDTDQNWKKKLACNDKGGLQQTIHNVVVVLREDEKLRKCLGYDLFTRRYMIRKAVPWKSGLKHMVPWGDADDAGLRHYLERCYGLRGRENISDAVEVVMQANSFHPIRDYLDRLAWDGVSRLDRLLIDYMGAEDTAYTREATRKWLTAAVARVRDPGCKFDHMLILVGAQGLGKSQFFFRLARNAAWFSDSLSKFDNSKEAMEQLAGKWLIEVGELSVMKRSEVEHVKTFLSKQEDAYRPSYGRRLETFPRQCIFGGTTNRDDFLQDSTGNRRFWPVSVRNCTKMWNDLSTDMVDQIWAEADINYTLGEDLYLTGQAANEATESQDRFMELGGKIGVAEEFLNKLLPENWSELNIPEKFDWLKGYGLGEQESGTRMREEISGVELYVECFKGRIEEYRKIDAYEMTDILLKLGWERGKDRIRINGYGQQRMFKRPNTL